MRSIKNWVQSNSMYPMALIFAIFIVLLWLPFDLRRVGLSEEWNIYWYFLSVSGTVLPSLSLGSRALVLLPNYIAYLLTPNSFLSLNILFALLFWSKAFVFYAILRRLMPEAKDFAFSAAILFLIFPLDEGLFNLRVTAGHSAVLTYLIAVLGLVLFHTTCKVRWLILMMVASLISLFQYEASFPLFVITPVVLLLHERGYNTKVRNSALLWYIAPLGWLVIFIKQTFFPDSGQATYQSSRLITNGGLQLHKVRTIFDVTLRMYVRGLATEWWESLLLIAKNPLFTGLSLLGAAILGAVLYFQTDSASIQFSQPKTREKAILLVLGLILALFGFAAYLISILRVELWRVFYYASIGMGISAGAVLLLIRDRFRSITLYSTLFAIMVFLAMVRSYDQFARLHRWSDQVETLASNVLDVVPSLREPTIIVITSTNDPSQPLYRVTPEASTFPWAQHEVFRYIYGDVPSKVDSVIVCLSVTPAGSDCSFTEAGLEVISYMEAEPPFRLIPYDKMVILNVSEDSAMLLTQVPGIGDVATYQPLLLVGNTYSNPTRLAELFGPDWLATSR